jgi:hypothetical protein
MVPVHHGAKPCGAFGARHFDSRVAGTEGVVHLVVGQPEEVRAVPDAVALQAR